LYRDVTQTWDMVSKIAFYGGSVRISFDRIEGPQLLNSRVVPRASLTASPIRLPWYPSFSISLSQIFSTPE
jgi:hypothetical protein